MQGKSETPSPIMPDEFDVIIKGSSGFSVKEHSPTEAQRGRAATESRSISRNVEGTQRPEIRGEK